MNQQALVPFYEQGLSVIRAVQSVATPFLTKIMEIISNLGSPTAYVLLFAFLFWAVDSRRAFRLVFLTVVSFSFNTIIKQTLRFPRPFVLDPSVGLVPETGFSTPSGHAQTAATFWGIFATLLPGGTGGKTVKKLFIGIGIPLCIGFTRVYLGVHFPQDVLFGWFLGAVCTAVSVWVWPPVSARIAAIPRSIQLLLLAVLVFVLNALCPEDRSMPAALLGLGAGYILLREQGGFDAGSGTAARKLLRFAIGLAGLALIYLGLKLVLPGKQSSLYEIFRFIRYALIGFWAFYCVPTLSIKLKLANRERRTGNGESASHAEPRE